MIEDPVPSVFESAFVASLKPGDVVLYRVPGQLTQKSRDVIVAMLNEVFPDHESIILEGGADVAVLRPQSGLLRQLFGKRESS